MIILHILSPTPTSNSPHKFTFHSLQTVGEALIFSCSEKFILLKVSFYQKMSSLLCKNIFLLEHFSKSGNRFLDKNAVKNKELKQSVEPQTEPK